MKNYQNTDISKVFLMKEMKVLRENELINREDRTDKQVFRVLELKNKGLAGMIKRESRLSECNLSVTKKASWGNTHEAFPLICFSYFTRTMS